MAKIVNKITFFFVLLLEACKIAMNIWCVYFQFPTNAIFKYASRYAEELVAVYIYNNRSMCEHTMYQDAYVHYPRICRSLSTLFVMWYECGESWVVASCQCVRHSFMHTPLLLIDVHTVHLYHAVSVFCTSQFLQACFFFLLHLLSLLFHCSCFSRISDDVRPTDRKKNPN